MALFIRPPFHKNILNRSSTKNIIPMAREIVVYRNVAHSNGNEMESNTNWAMNRGLFLVQHLLAGLTCFKQIILKHPASER